MPRRETVDLVMRRAYRKRDVEGYVWSFLKLTEEEIRKERPVEESSEDWGNWGSPPNLQVVEDDDDGEEEAE